MGGSVQLDFSKMQPITPPPNSGGVALDFSKMQPISNTPVPQPAEDDLTANPNGEGTYQMQGPDGRTKAVPYSQVRAARQVPGTNFTSLDEQSRYQKDLAYDPKPHASYLADYNQPEEEIAKGALKSAVEVPNTIAGWLDSLSNKLTDAMGRQREKPVRPALEKVENAIAPGITNPTHGFNQRVGATAETLLEWAYGEGEAKEAIKSMSVAERMKNAAGIAQFLEKHQGIAKAAGIGVRAAAQGAGVTGQALLHGQNVGDATTGGLVATGLGLGLGGAGEVAANQLAKRSATKEMVGGVETVIPAEVRNVKPTPQQVSGQESIRNAAQDTLGQRLQEVNESRAVPEETQPLLPTRTGPFTFKLQGLPTAEERTGQMVQDAAKRPQAAYKPPQYVTSSRPTPSVPGNEGSFGADISTDAAPEPGGEKVTGGGTLETQDPNIVREHIRNINNVVDSPDFERMPPEQQQALLDARTDAQNQLGQYHRQVTDSIRAGRPNLPQIDIPTTIKKVGSYSEAAQHLENIATDGYNSISDALQLNDISGGKFNTIRNANKEAWSAYKGATTPEALRAAEHTIDSTNQQMTDMLANDIHGAVTPKELAGFNDAYAASQRLKYVADAVDRAFSGNESGAARSWEYRGFNGTQLMSNLNRLQTKFGRASLERVVGAQNLDTLYQVAELNRTGAARARFGAAIKPVAESLIKLHAGPIALGGYLGHVTGVGWEAGAAAGAALPYATKRVMNAVLSDPNTAQNLIFAIKAGARPENYGPMIAAMIQRHETEQAKQQQQPVDSQP